MTKMKSSLNVGTSKKGDARLLFFFQLPPLLWFSVAYFEKNNHN